MRLSVIIVSYNVRDLLRACLSSLDGADEVIVVDNGSTDGSVEMVECEFPRTVVLERRDNPGFGAAVNLAASKARGDAYFLLNPDCRLEIGQLAQMRGRLALHPEAGAVGFRQVDDEGRFQLAHGGEARFWPELVRFVVQTTLDRGHRGVGTFVDTLYRRPVDVAWVAGSSLLVRRESFEVIGGFDENFFLYFEDIDFCLRLRAHRQKVVYDPTVTLTHHRGQSAKQNRQVASRSYRQSQRYFWRKHRGRFAESLVVAYQYLRGVGLHRYPDTME